MSTRNPNVDMFEEVAAGRITSEQAADAIMKKREEEQQCEGQPAWMPRWAWIGWLVIIIGIPTFLGFRRD